MELKVSCRFIKNLQPTPIKMSIKLNFKFNLYFKFQKSYFSLSENLFIYLTSINYFLQNSLLYVIVAFFKILCQKPIYFQAFQQVIFFILTFPYVLFKKHSNPLLFMVQGTFISYVDKFVSHVFFNLGPSGQVSVVDCIAFFSFTSSI